MDNDDIMQKLYEDFFKGVDKDKPSSEKDEEIISNEPISAESNPNYERERNISTIDQLCEILRIVLNTSLGYGWGTFKPFLSKKDMLSNDKVLPIITYDVNSREVSRGTQIKPTLSGVINEVVNGKPTGDVIEVYRQQFDVIVEFNIWGRNSIETRQLSERFETTLNSYIGYLKKLGVSEMFFLKEIPCQRSVNYISEISMRSLMYYVRLERINKVRNSTLQKIDVEVNKVFN